MKKYYNKILTLILSTLVVVGLAGTILADNNNPVFNQKNGDSELFTGRNITKGQTVSSDPVEADVTDEVEGVIYYHNGIEGTTAKNVRISATLDQITSTKKVVMTAKISADNVTSVSDTIVSGQIVGKSGLTVNLTNAGVPNYVSGSARWFREAQNTASPLLNNQTGAELFTTNGISIGDIEGCWSHSGYIMFRIKFTQPNPNIVKSKSAFNDTQNIDATKIVAKPSDQITYSLVTKNTGNGDQLNYVVEDGINDILDYADVVGLNGGILVNQPASTVRDNQVIIRYPAVTVAKGATVTNTFVVKVKNPLPTNTTVGFAYDGVMFNSYGNDVRITVTAPNCDATIAKTVRNVSKGESAYSLNNSANPGDVLDYFIKVKNIGNVAFVPNVKDILPNGVTANVNGLSSEYKGNPVTLSGDILTGGLVLPSISPNDEITVNMQTTVDTNLANNTNLLNVVKVGYCALEKESSASTLVLAPVKPEVIKPDVVKPLPVKPTPALPKAGPGLLGTVTVFIGSVAGVVVKSKKIN